MRTLFIFAGITALLLSGCTEQPEIQQYTIEQFFDNKAVSGGVFSPDETKLLVSSNETGIWNVWEITIADGTREQITSSGVESFFANSYVPETGEILYSADKGGNEITHIYLLKADGSSVDLTPGEQEKASFAGWSEDDKYMYYLSNKRDPMYFDFYKMDPTDWSSEMMYRNDEGLDIDALSDDESMMTLFRSVTTSENRLFLLNRETGERTEISDPGEPGTYSSQGFSADNRYLFYTTDAGKEFTYLVKYDIETGDRETIFETSWDVMYSYLSENETFRVIGINEDGKTNLIIKDNETWEDIPFPQIPDGNVVAVNIADSETMMRLTVGTSKSPGNIYVYDFESGDLKKLTETLNPEINPDDLVAAEVVRYPSFDGLDIPAIFYKPHQASAKNPVPALVWVHGGPGGQSRVGFSSTQQYLINHGYAILAVNNRGSSGYGKTFYKMDDRNHGDKDLKDCIWGKKWLQQQEYIDPDKIGILGGSYGGFMTMAAMAFEPDEFAVGVNIVGVTNWLRTLKSIPPYWESYREALYTEMGDPFTDDSVRLYNISPVFHGDKVKNPVMVLQGANDPRVLRQESDDMVAAMKEAGATVEYVIFPDEGHGFRKKANRITAYRQVREFLDQYLKGEMTDHDHDEDHDHEADHSHEEGHGH